MIILMTCILDLSLKDCCAIDYETTSLSPKICFDIDHAIGEKIMMIFLMMLIISLLVHVLLLLLIFIIWHWFKPGNGA